jgi:hypothetical protein
MASDAHLRQAVGVCKEGGYLLLNGQKMFVKVRAQHSHALLNRICAGQVADFDAGGSDST